MVRADKSYEAKVATRSSSCCRPTSRCLDVHRKTEGTCPGITRPMIHGEVATVTADGCSRCRTLQVGALRAHSLQQEGMLSRGS